MNAVKKCWSLLLLPLLGLMLSSGPALSAQVLTLTYGPPTTAPHQAIGLEFARLVEEKTKGAYTVQVFGNSSLAGGNQVGAIEMVQNGAISCGWLSNMAQAAVEPNLNVPSIPWLWKNNESIDKAFNMGTESHKILNRIMNAKGYEIVGYGENGFRQVTNNIRPIHTPADMKGIKFRVIGSLMLLDSFKALGANPVDINFGELFTAMQQGTVDGQESPVTTIFLPGRFMEVQKYMTIWNYSYEPHPLMFNKALWDSFTPEVKKGIQESADVACQMLKDKVRAEEAANIKMLSGEMDVYTLSAAELQAFKDAVAPALKPHLAEFDKELLDAMMKANQ